MNISGLDFFLINIISYISGIATGLIICCKNKDKLLVKSRSLDNMKQYNPPIIASAPPAAVVTSSPTPVTAVPSQITKITLE